MFKKHVFTGTLAAMCAAVGLSAQSAGQQQDPAQPTTQTEPSEGAETTVTGCVYKESDVPGRSPNVAEQAGILEDYILADTEVSGQPGSASPGSTPGATGAAGSMYKLEHADDEQLSAAVGKRVEVTGRIDAEATDSPTTPDEARTRTDESLGPDQVELPELEVTSIRNVEGTCPTTPGGGR